MALPAFEDMSKPEHMPIFEDMNMPEHLPVFEDMSKSEFMPEDSNLSEFMPEDSNLPEHIPRNEVVDAFREEIDMWFVRYQTFYDRTNAAMRSYRLQHVELVSRIYNALMVVFGDEIEQVRMMTYDLIDMINARAGVVGGMNECLNGIMAQSGVYSQDVGGRIQACALRSNTTLSDLLTNTFYPTFAAIQTETSTIPISVIDILSRGNVLEDEEAILQYLQDRYTVIELQWLGGVSQLLRWETNRFENDGLFLVDEMAICMANATFQFLLNMSFLEGTVQDC